MNFSPIIILDIFLALIPGLFWLWWFLRKDRAKPEPKGELALVFILGMLATIPALGLELIAETFFPFSSSTEFFTLAIGSLLIVAPIEEFMKFAAVRWSAFRSRHFDEGIDGVIYMITGALGFATAENILIVIQEGADVLPLRLISATLLHALASGLVGYYLGLAKFYPQYRTRLMIEGLVVGIIMHGLYNFIALSQTPLTLFLLVLLMVVLYILLSGSIREVKRRKLSLDKPPL